MAEGESKVERWLPIESNPEVMNSFLRKLGVPADWEINDVFGLDPELLMMLPQPVLALMLLFPITDKYEEFAREQEEKMKAELQRRFFKLEVSVADLIWVGNLYQSSTTLGLDPVSTGPPQTN